MIWTYFTMVTFSLTRARRGTFLALYTEILIEEKTHKHVRNPLRPLPPGVLIFLTQPPIIAQNQILVVIHWICLFLQIFWGDSLPVTVLRDLRNIMYDIQFVQFFLVRMAVMMTSRLFTCQSWNQNSEYVFSLYTLAVFLVYFKC